MIRVLVVDDDRAVGMAIKMVLEVAGFEVIHALDCMSGLAELDKSSGGKTVWRQLEPVT